MEEGDNAANALEDGTDEQMFLNTDQTFDMEVAIPSTENVIEVDDAAADVWTVDDVLDVEEEGQLFCGKYRYMT